MKKNERPSVVGPKDRIDSVNDKGSVEQGDADRVDGVVP
jgi:hypothetical protein